MTTDSDESPVGSYQWVVGICGLDIRVWGSGVWGLDAGVWVWRLGVGVLVLGLSVQGSGRGLTRCRYNILGLLWTHSENCALILALRVGPNRRVSTANCMAGGGTFASARRKMVQMFGLDLVQVGLPFKAGRCLPSDVGFPHASILHGS